MYVNESSNKSSYSYLSSHTSRTFALRTLTDSVREHGEVVPLRVPRVERLIDAGASRGAERRDGNSGARRRRDDDIGE